MQKQNFSPASSLTHNSKIKRNGYRQHSSEKSLFSAFRKSKSDSKNKTIKTEEFSIKKLFKESANRAQAMDFRDFGEIEKGGEICISNIEELCVIFKAVFLFTTFFLAISVLQVILASQFFESSEDFQSDKFVAFAKIAFISLMLLGEMLFWRKVIIKKQKRSFMFQLAIAFFSFLLVSLLISELFFHQLSVLDYFSLGFSTFFLTILNSRPNINLFYQAMMLAFAFLRQFSENEKIQSILFSSIALFTIFLNYWLQKKRFLNDLLRSSEFVQCHETKKFYKSFLNLFPDGLAFIGQDLDLEYANASFLGVLSKVNNKLDFESKLQRFTNVNHETNEKTSSLRRTRSFTSFDSPNSFSRKFKNHNSSSERHLKAETPKASSRGIQKNRMKRASKSLKSLRTLKTKTFIHMNTLKPKTQKSRGSVSPTKRSFLNLFVSSTSTFLRGLTKKDSIREKFPERLHHTDPDSEFLDSIIFGKVRKVEFQRVSAHLPSIFVSNHRNLYEAVKTTLEKMLAFKKSCKDVSKFNIEFNSILIFKTLLETKSLEIKLIPIFYKDEPKLILSLNDCSDLITIELLKRTDEYKNTLMSYVSHELRTPLNGMLSLMESVKEKVSLEINEQFVIPSLNCGKNLLSLVNDILDFEQIRKGKMRLLETEFSLKNCLDETLNIVKLQAQKKRLGLILNIDKSVPAKVSTDVNRLRQIVLNLLGNALKFTLEGSITVQVESFQFSSQILKVSVIDTGLGIKAEDQKKLFKQFGKLDLQDKNYLNSQGVGLGLIISHSLAIELGPPAKTLQAMRGLKVKSEPGKGSEFWFLLENRRKLQAEDLDDQEIIEISSNCGILKSSADFRNKFLNNLSVKPPNGNLLCWDFKPSSMNSSLQCPSLRTRETLKDSSPMMKIAQKPRNSMDISPKDFLIVDDDCYNSMILEKLLQKLNSSSENCNNGKEAVDKIKEKLINKKPIHYKAIFMDCEMPIMNGFEATREIKRLLAENGKDIKIWGCTAHVQEKERRRCLEAGMDEVLVKPIEVKQVERLIATINRKQTCIENIIKVKWNSL